MLESPFPDPDHCDRRRHDAAEEEGDHYVLMVQFSRVEQIMQGEKVDVVQHHEERESPENGEELDAQRILLESRGPASGAGIEPILSTFLAARRSA